MLVLQSTQPSLGLQRYVRAYAQRSTSIQGPPVTESVPARLEPILEFEFGDPFEVAFADGPIITTPRTGIIGPQTHLRASIRLVGKIESFAVFFQPAAFTQLFGVPLCALLDSAYEATSVMGTEVRSLWNRLSACLSFFERVAVMENALLKIASRARSTGVMGDCVNYMLACGGAINIASLANQMDISRRQFERRFMREVGLPPKKYLRIARFQMALDAKLANPRRTWLDIAHHFQYHDQMHMIHDFSALANGSPNRVLATLGDMRPEALTRSETVQLPQKKQIIYVSRFNSQDNRSA
jgi:AraC-like DNA-binding protein